MKKDKLIELLSTIEGNPDIYLWNGIAEDWIDIDQELVKIQLYHRRKSQIKESIHFEMLRDLCNKKGISFEERHKLETSEFLNHVDEVTEKSYKTHYKGWHLPNASLDKEQMKQWYDKSKTCYVLNHKTKGRSVNFIRGGSIAY